MFKCSLLAIVALSTAGLYGCGDNLSPSGPPVLASPHLYVTTTQGSTVEIDATATDSLDRALTYTAGTPAHGTISGTGPKFTYTPDDGFVGEDELTITISNGNQTATVTVTITVAAQDAVPVTADATSYIAQNGFGAIQLTAIDSDSSSLTFTVVGTPEHGSLSGDAPSLIYTPAADFSGIDTLTYEASDGMETSNVSTITINVTVCGDGTQTPNEQCDDGNTIDGDGCSASCVTEKCGDGLLQLGINEQCDDGNNVSGDGCTSNCLVEPATSTLPVQISGGLLNCTTAPANATHKVASDTADLYGVMLCGTNGYVVVSHDHGGTFSPPLALTLPPPGQPPGSVVHVATSVGVAGTAYVGYMLASGDVLLRTTIDHGATWSTPVLIGIAADTFVGFSLGSFNHEVFLAFSTGAPPPAGHPAPAPTIEVFTNHHDGVGAFGSVVLTTSGYQNFDLLYDPTLDVMVLGVDDTTLHVRTSIDRGATWSPAAPAAGAQQTGDWALGGAHLYVSGIDGGATSNSDTLFYYTPLLTVTPEVGLPSVTTLRSRSLAADIAGNAFIATQLDGLGGGIQLDRFQVAFGFFDPSRQISVTGSHPVVTNLMNDSGAAVIYTDAGAVWMSVQAYQAGCPGHAPC